MEHTARRVVMTRIVTTSAREPPSGAMRLVVLLALVAVALLWLQHHIGFQFAKLGVIAAATTAWTAIEKILDVLGQKSAMSATQERAVRPLRSALRLASRPGPLGVIAVLLVIPMVFLTTVTVTSEQTVSDPTKVSISALDSRAGLLEDSLTGRRALARFFVVTNPFGRLFRISARGYLPTALVVYPPVGRNVVLGRDLPPAPSVLFRPFVEGISALNDKAVFQVSRITPKGAKEVLTTDTGIVASFRLGPARPITPSIIEFWRLELESYDASPPLRAHMLMVWNTPRELKWAGDLSPGDSLQAEILRRGKVIARASFAVTRDPLMDVLIMDLPIESSPRP